MQGSGPPVPASAGGSPPCLRHHPLGGPGPCPQRSHRLGCPSPCRSAQKKLQVDQHSPSAGKSSQLSDFIRRHSLPRVRSSQYRQIYNHNGNSAHRVVQCTSYATVHDRPESPLCIHLPQTSFATTSDPVQSPFKEVERVREPGQQRSQLLTFLSASRAGQTAGCSGTRKNLGTSAFCACPLTCCGSRRLCWRTS